ncbi:unnamed protein product [Jaminaea pallidilutea]
MRATATAYAALLLLWTTFASAQFFNFFQSGQQQPREQEPPPSGDASWFEARTEAANCPNYLCPRTLSCVPNPSRCPCPFPQQTRCSYPDPITGEIDGGGSFCITDDHSSPSCEKVLLSRGMWWGARKLEDPGLRKLLDGSL